MTPADKALVERLRGKHCCNADACNCDECADRITALSAELAAVIDPIGAGIMRDRAVVQMEAGASAHDAMGERSTATAIRLQSAAIRALPLPAHADRLAAALTLPKVKALVEWLREKTRDVETYDTMYDDARADIYVGDILERLAALTPTAVDDSAGEPT